MAKMIANVNFCLVLLVLFLGGLGCQQEGTSKRNLKAIQNPQAPLKQVSSGEDGSVNKNTTSENATQNLELSSSQKSAQKWMTDDEVRQELQLYNKYGGITIADPKDAAELTKEQIMAAPLLSIPKKFLVKTPEGFFLDAQKHELGDLTQEYNTTLKKLFRKADLYWYENMRKDLYENLGLKKELLDVDEKEIQEILGKVEMTYLQKIGENDIDALSSSQRAEIKKFQNHAYRTYITKNFPEDTNSKEEGSLSLEKRCGELWGIAFHRATSFISVMEYSFAGEIHDELGKPLSDVKVILKFTNSDYRGSRKIVHYFKNGKFHFRTKPFHGTVGISFQKKGYYLPTEWTVPLANFGKASADLESLSVLRSPEMLKLAMANKFPAPFFEKRHNIRVQLTKIEKLGRLTEYEGKITSRGDGSGVIMTLDKSKTNKHKILRQIKNLNDPKLIPDYSIVFSAKPDVDGKFNGTCRMSANIPYAVRQENNYFPILDCKLKMKSSDPTDGFWRVDPRQKGTYHQDRRMQEAPKSGYVRELQFGSGHKYQKGSFYVKINGKYGKCTLDRNTFRYHSDHAGCDLKVMLQEDGSRNLKTRLWFATSPYKKYSTK